MDFGQCPGRGFPAIEVILMGQVKAGMVGKAFQEFFLLVRLGDQDGQDRLKPFKIHHQVLRPDPANPSDSPAVLLEPDDGEASGQEVPAAKMDDVKLLLIPQEGKYLGIPEMKKELLDADVSDISPSPEVSWLSLTAAGPIGQALGEVIDTTGTVDHPQQAGV